MQLETMRPNPTWDAASYEDAVETLAGMDDATIHVWGGDWCTDCRAQLPDFAAALDAAALPTEQIHHHPVEKHDDGSKSGELVAAYDIDRIPTVVVELDGSERARFVESADVPIVVSLAEQLS